MKYYLFVWILVIWNANFGFATSANPGLELDSSKAGINMEKGNDWMEAVSYDSAISRFRLAVKLYEKHQLIDQALQAKYAEGKAHYLFYTNKELYALSEAFQAKVARFQGPKGIYHAMALELKGYSTQRLGNPAQALELYLQSLAIKRQIFPQERQEIRELLLLIGGIHQSMGNWRQAEAIFKEILEGLSPLGFSEPDAATCLQYLGLIQGKLGAFEKALDYLSLSLFIRQRIFPANHPDMGWVYYSIKCLLIDYGDYKGALKYSKKNLETRLSYFGEVHPETAWGYCILGDAYSKLAQYDRAMEAYRKSLSLFYQTVGKNHLFASSLLYSMGTVAYEEKEFQKSLAYFSECLKISKKSIHWDHPDLIPGYKSIGKVYEGQGDYARALEMYRKSMEIGLKVYGKVHSRIGNDHINIGNVFHAQGNFSKALEQFQKAVEIYLELGGSRHPEVARSYNLIGGIHEANKDYVLAISYYQKAILAPFGGTVGKDNRKREGNAWNFDQHQYLSSLNNKGRALWLYGNSLRPEQQPAKTYPAELKNALETYLLALGRIDSLRFHYESQSGRQGLAKKYEEVFSSAMEVAHTLYGISKSDEYIEIAFIIAEKGKARSLLDALQDAGGKQYAKIPDSLLRGEEVLRKALFQQNNSFQNSLIEKDSLTIVEVSSVLFDLRNQYNALLRDLEETYPDYHRLKYSFQTASLREIQKKVPYRTAFIEFYESGEALFVISTTSSQYSFRRIPLDANLEAMLTSHKRELAGKGSSKGPKTAIATFGPAAHQLYLLLLQPELSRFTNGIDRLILLPHGQVHGIPFESLLLKPLAGGETSFASLPYLIREYAVQYAWSGTLYEADYEAGNSTHPLKNNREALAFAPHFEKGETNQLLSLRESGKESLKSLPGAEKEARMLSHFFKGKVFTGEYATKANFIRESPKAGLLHLATHGFADSLNPLSSKLAFQVADGSRDNGFLHAYEIYNLSLSADLAVLSSCLSGQGKFQEGEGIMSLAHAFAYAGCPSLLSALWQVDDRSSLEMMEIFYTGLANGLPKDRALQEAKIKFISSQGPYESHPFYWAVFIGIGEVSPLNIKPAKAIPTPNWLMPLIIIAFAVMMVLIIGTKKRRRASGAKG